MSGISMLGFDDVMNALDYESFGSREYRVGTNVEYAIYVEFGTSRNQAQPFLRPAVEQAVSELDQYAGDADSPEEVVERLALKIEEYAKDNAPVDTGNLRGSIEAQRVS
ncbi:hypothetical protein G6M89_09260 [Natronolimnobius sp. AArcel1]|uniref:HK97-gp10 family putative phage morphogenesis protein n=1 Tax=Natronolimnobius sp. AArcel1 TaxID=1679093 RepID=UPI0013EA7EB2|nr:HK97-gp10 family putative phage morphogenesis protein [Natronolimnobius sp. AArcel1]NGM69192.1 hypothetical protein [Natronolimnobius sp. AArcel1]